MTPHSLRDAKRMAALQADLWSRMLERPAALVADPAMTAPDRLDAVVEHLVRFESGVASGDFDLGGIDPDTVRQFLLHGYPGPCFHHRDPDTAVREMQRLFRRAVAAPEGP